MQARQCSERGGDLQVTVQKGSNQVLLASHAVVVSSGQLSLASVDNSGTISCREEHGAISLRAER